jgi:hypothetical protein
LVKSASVDISDTLEDQSLKEAIQKANIVRKSCVLQALLRNGHCQKLEFAQDSPKSSFIAENKRQSWTSDHINSLLTYTLLGYSRKDIECTIQREAGKIFSKI